MFRTLGRGLQFLGLLIPPCAIASELTGAVGLGRSMLLAAAGLVVFFIGVRIQGQAS